MDKPPHAAQAKRNSLLGRFPRFFRLGRQQRVLAVGVRWRKWVPWIPFPIRLPFGALWLVRNNQMGDTLFWYGTFAEEEPGLRFVERFLQPGMTVVDAGAHEGFYTLLASRRVGAAGKVIAFEPSLRERKALRWHTLINGCSNVKIKGVALGEESGDAKLYVVESTRTGFNSLRPPSVPGQSKVQAVSVIRLDECLNDLKLGRVDLIKLDVEGAELSVLRGATELLRRPPRPIIMAEVEDIHAIRWGYQAREIVAFLEDLGYEWYRPLTNATLAPIGPERREFQENLIAIPKERREEVLSRVTQAC